MEGSNEIWAAPLSDYRIAVLVLLLGRRNRHKTAGPPPPARHLRRHPRQEQETQGNEGEEESSALTGEKAVERMAPSKLCRAAAPSPLAPSAASSPQLRRPLARIARLRSGGWEVGIGSGPWRRWIGQSRARFQSGRPKTNDTSSPDLV